MIDFILAHKTVILAVLLTISELLALLVPSSGGIMKVIMDALKSLGAKDAGNQP